LHVLCNGRIGLKMSRFPKPVVMAAILATLVAAPSGAQRWRGGAEVTSIAETTPTDEEIRQQQQLQQSPFGGRVREGLDAPIDPDTYVVGPYDQFLLVLRGQTQKELRLQVLPEGTIILPNYGAFPVAGQTVTELRNRLSASLKKYYTNVDFDLQLIKPRSLIVYVLGEVEDPGAVQVDAPFRLSAAIEAAGGIKNVGSQRFIEILEDGKTVRLADLFSFFQLGKMEGNPALKEGQAVFVPARQAFATIYGLVWNAGAYEVRPGETVSDLIRFAGGTRDYAQLDRVTVERHDPSGRATIEHYTSADLDTVGVHARDIVVVPDARLFGRGDYVMIRGGGGREGKVNIEKGETLEEFAPRFYQLREDHDLRRAVIERENEDGSAEFIPVDLEKVVEGDAENPIVLQRGDIISIPMMENSVYVAGEVVNPSAIPFQRGMPAERYIAMAGGPTRSGSMNKITIYSKDGTSRKGDRSSEVYRGDTILLERTIGSYVGPAFVAFTSLTSLILSVIAVSR
jgi:protein involved in polysaccharide export with SLBB domain